MRTFHITTKRLGFSRWQEEDLPLALQLWGDRAVTQFISKDGFSEQEIGERLGQEIASQENAGVQYWPVFSKEEREFVGCCGLRPTEQPRVLELGFHLLPAHWGKGLAAEAAAATIAYARFKLGVGDVVAGHHPENLRSRGVLLKLGFAAAGEVYYPPTGLLHPLYRLGAIRVQKTPER